MMSFRILFLSLALRFSTMSANAQVVDAFQCILPVTDPAMMVSLNGNWKLKVVEGVDDKKREVPPEDASWSDIPVPGCWEAYGFCKPSYDKALPLTGYYRTAFSIPESWNGQRIVLRFDGVLYGYDLWINGRQAGAWRSGYNTALFDITPYIIRNRRQELALRVISRFPGSDFDYNDDWAPNGIFRDVTLMAVPDVHLSDLTIHTRNTGEVSVETLIANNRKGTVVKYEIRDAVGKLVGTNKVEHPHLWTAETPYLYTLRTTLLLKGKILQTFEHKFGFREVTIDGNILKLNGKPIKLRGVTCHSTDPQTVKVISERLTLKDMKLMKEASVNYIRTSHYPREPRFYELADSLGFYVIDEVPFGFGDKNLSDSTFYPVLQQRAQATIRRDKNHPSVLIWSLGNENPLTPICIQLGDYVKNQLDNSRPYCYPQVGSYFRRFVEGSQAKGFPSPAAIYAPHYPTTEQIAGIYQHLDRPVIFTEYCHTLGISFEDHNRQWEIIQKTPGIAGGSVWEWVDQGMPFSRLSSPSSRFSKYGYQEKVYTTEDSGFEMSGNKGTDGLLYADRTPLPNYYELQRNYARAFVVDSIIAVVGNQLSLNIENRYDFLNLKDHVTFNWIYTEDRDTIAQGAFSPNCAPHATVPYSLVLPMAPDKSRMGLLHLTITDAQGYTFLRQSLPLYSFNLASRLLQALTESAADPMTMVQEGPLVRAGRKATLAEMVKVADRRLERYLLRLPAMGAHVQRCAEGNVMHYSVTLSPDSSDTFLGELGVAFLLDNRIDRVQWIGNGPFPTYPGRYRAGRYGWWAMQQGDLYFEGNRRGVDAALLTNRDGDGLLLFSHHGDVNFEQTDRGVVLTVNAAVSGQGPKFRWTAFPIIAHQVGTVSVDFYLYRVEAGHMPMVLKNLFQNPVDVQAPYKPFVTQYDTYLMRFEDIVE